MIYKSKRNAKRQKVLNLKIILPVIIILGVITRPFWKKIFAKPVGMIVEFSEKTKIFWPALIGVLIFTGLFIYNLINFIKLKKGIKLKNDKRTAKQLLFVVIIFFIALIMGIIGLVFAQMGLMKLK